ncbi:MAG: HAMP domain-containing histidine kinase [Ignavibacteriae bacterium]|nr:HAMP domain-containing histidine kinase [Ignavibacteriota bacterium]
MDLTLPAKVHENKLQILGKLAASLTHEIKNPLSVIKLNLDYLKMSSEKYDEETLECIDASLEAADMIDKLIYNTLEFSRKYRDDFNHYYINEIINKSVSITKGNANKKNISFQLKLADGIPKIKISETKILQVFVNIISNSIEASEDNSNILINSFQNNGNVKVEIIDEGLGISEEKINEIFNDFYTSKENGTGLGLSVCKSILEEHEAKFELKNNTTKGTNFTIEFKVE